MNVPGIVAPIATIAGVVLLTGSVGWRVWSKRRSLASLQRAIEDRDPVMRRAALATLGSRGLTTFAELLVSRALVETDQGVRRTLVEVVLRNDWEPADNRELLTLRLWAHAQSLEAQAIAIATPAPAPVPARSVEAPTAPTAPTAISAGRHGEPGTMAVAALRSPTRRRGHARANRAPVLATAGQGSGDHRGGVGTALVENPQLLSPSVPTTGPGRPARRVPPPVFDWAGDTSTSAPSRPAGTNGHQSSASATLATRSPYRNAQPTIAAVKVSSERVTAIVTGAGGPAGIAVIRALRSAGHRVVAADADPLAAGLRLAHGAGIIPAAEDPRFVTALCQLAVASAAQVIVPTVAEELPILAEAGRYLQADAGVRTWVPSAAAVEVCSDKWQFAQLLARHGILGPATSLGSIEGIPGPWVVKPRSGRGSRDVYLVDQPEDMATVLRRVSDPIVQTRLRGREFTVDTLVGPDGILAGAVPRWRLETKAGISTKGRTFVDDRLVREVARLLAIVGLCGPANVQGFVDHAGTPWFMEVNPRFSGGLPLSLAAGADLVGEYVRGVLGQPIRPERLMFRPDVTMIRHFEETFE